MTGKTILLTDCVVKKRVTVKFCQTRGKKDCELSRSKSLRATMD